MCYQLLICNEWEEREKKKNENIIENITSKYAMIIQISNAQTNSPKYEPNNNNDSSNNSNNKTEKIAVKN